MTTEETFPPIIRLQVDDTTAFLRAARSGNLEKVIEFLDTDLDINTANSNGLNALHLASKDGHVEIVTELLKRGAKVDAATKKGNTALHIASLAGQSEIVSILIQYGAAVNIQSQNGFTPLYMAAQENHDQVVKLLLSNGANQSLATEDGFTPLAVAMQQGHDKVVSVLLENDSKGKVRLPALHIAAKKDDCKAADLLLQNDHKPDVTSKSGFTPLHIAAHYGNEEIARLLIKRGADVNYLAKHNISPLHVAAKWGKNNMVKVLLENSAQIDAKTKDGLTPLHCAARSGHEQVITTLLEHSAPISARTKNGLAPLHMASQGDYVDAARVLLYHRAPVDEVTVDYLTSLHVAAHCGHVRVAKLLLDRKADPNARALNGFTPLHIACKKNRIKVVELLLKHGASIKSTTESGLTPLHVASFMGCMNIVIFLLQHEANPDVTTVRGETPLHLAARANQTDIIRILLRNGAKVDARAREQQTPLHIASRLGNIDIVMLLLQHGAAVDTTTKDMYTALHIAAKEGQEEVATILVDNNASLKATTKNGFTPLHIAAKYGNMSVAKILLQRDSKLDAQGKNDITPLHLACHYDHPNVANLLLEKGASPHVASQNGHTPLHIAARKNQMDIASTLLENGANANAESKAGFTPLHLSAQKGHYDMTNLLIEHGANPNHRSKNGLSALHLCAQEDFIKVASILVKNGANVESETETGYRPIHIAAHFGNLSMIRFLLKHNANIDVRTNQNYTPLHQAAQQGHAHVVTALLEGNASHKAKTKDGLTALNIAQKLGYISVTEVLKGLSYDTLTPDNKNWDEKYKVIAPESLQETSFMSDSDDEGGSDTLINEQPYRYLTADLMKSLRDDSLPIDVTRDDPIHRQVTKEEKKEFTQSNNYCLAENFDTDGINLGFLVSFLVDARGGAMKGCRHSGVRIIVPPRKATMPIRVTCRLIKPSKVTNPPPLMEGEALATRIIEMGPIGATFLGPVLIDIPHFASIRGKEREIIILRSENGETWKEHDNSADNDDTLLNTPYDPQMSASHSGRITRIITSDFPQYFAIVTRIKQEVHVIGSEGGILISSVANHVQAVFPPGALTKKIKVGLQAHVIPAELTAKLLGNCVAVSPVITIEPRRRKFHKPITLTIPVPQAANKGMINQYGGETPTLRLLCSIAGGTSESQWEDVTGSTPLTFMNDRVSFTTTVSARFWLMDCQNITAVPKMATELYEESLFVPYITNFVIYSKRMDVLEATLRILCMTDGKEGIHTLERQEEFVEIVKSRDVEVLDGKDLYIEFSGNLIPVTKSGVQLKFTFKAFRQNRLSFHVKVKDPLSDPVARMLFMKEPKVAKGEPPQQPICVLNIVLPEITTKLEIQQKSKDYEDSNIISQKWDSYESKYKKEGKEKSDEPKDTSPSEKKFITDTLEKERTDAVTIHESLAQKAASFLESVDASYPSKVVGQEQDLSPSVERQTYFEKRKFWEDISRKRESYQRSESEVSRSSQLTINESETEYGHSGVTEDMAEIGPQVESSETMEDLNVPDISECSVAEKAQYFEEQIQKETTKLPSKLQQQDSLKSDKEKLTKTKVSDKEKEDKDEKHTMELKEIEKMEERKEIISSHQVQMESVKRELEKWVAKEEQYESKVITDEVAMDVSKKELIREKRGYMESDEAVTEKVDEPEILKKDTESLQEKKDVKKVEKDVQQPVSIQQEIVEKERKSVEEKQTETTESIKESVKEKKEKEDLKKMEEFVTKMTEQQEDIRKEQKQKEELVIEVAESGKESIRQKEEEKDSRKVEESVTKVAEKQESLKKEQKEEIVTKSTEGIKEKEEEKEDSREVKESVTKIIKKQESMKEKEEKEEDTRKVEFVAEQKEKETFVKEAVESIKEKEKETETLRKVEEAITKVTVQQEQQQQKEEKEFLTETTVQQEDVSKKQKEAEIEEKRVPEIIKEEEKPQKPIMEEKQKQIKIIEEMKVKVPEGIKTTDVVTEKTNARRVITEQTTIIYKVQQDGTLLEEKVTKSVQIEGEGGRLVQLPEERIKTISEEWQDVQSAEVKKELEKLLERKEKMDIGVKKETEKIEQEAKIEKLEEVPCVSELITKEDSQLKEEEKPLSEIEPKHTKKEFESRIPISMAKMDKDKVQKEKQKSPTEPKSLSRSPSDKDSNGEKEDVVSPSKKKEFESRIPKRITDVKLTSEKAGKKEAHVKKESETITITEKKSSEEVTSKLEEHLTTKTETQTFAKTFTDPREAFKMFEDKDIGKNEFAVVTSKVDHKVSSTLEEKEVVSSEIFSGTDRVITLEEKERVEKKKSSESQLKKESPTETLEEKSSKREELDKTAIQKMSMNVTDTKEIIDAAASESRVEMKNEEIIKKLSDKEGITTREVGSTISRESDADVAIRIKKDVSGKIDDKGDAQTIMEKLKPETEKRSTPVDLGQVETLVQGESYKESKESFDVTRFEPSEKARKDEDSKEDDQKSVKIESLEEQQRRKFKEIEARTIAETLIQSIESEIEAKSAADLKAELLNKGYIEQIMSDEKLADDLTRKFESIMKKTEREDSRSIPEESHSKDSTRESISEDITRDEESSSNEKESLPLSSSQVKLQDRDITMSPSSISEQIDFEETIDVDTNESEGVSKATSSLQFEKEQSELPRDSRSEASFPHDKIVSEISGARVLEILEPSGDVRSREDSVDVPSLEMDEQKISEQTTSRGIPSLRESAEMDSFERLVQERDITISPSTVSEDTNVDYSLVQELSLSAAMQKDYEPVSTKRTDSFEIESPPMVSPKPKVRGLEIKPVDWMIGDEKIEISETLEPSQIFDQELEAYETMKKKERLSSQDGSTDHEQESATKSSEDVSVIEPTKDTVSEARAASKNDKFTVITVTEQDFDNELVENKLDVSCQELVDTLQREYDAKTPIKEYVESMEEERKSSEEERKSSEEERKSSEEEKKSIAEERKFSEGEKKSSEEERKSSEEERKPSEEKRKSSEEEKKSIAEERKFSEGEKKSSEEERKSSEEERKPSEEERKSSEEEKKSIAEERKFSEGEKKSSEDERKSSEEKKSSEEERKSSEQEKKSSKEERKFSEEEKKFSEGEKSIEKERKFSEGEKKSSEEERKSSEEEKKSSEKVTVEPERRERRSSLTVPSELHIEKPSEPMKEEERTAVEDKMKARENVETESEKSSKDERKAEEKATEPEKTQEEEPERTIRVGDALKEWTEAYLSKMKPSGDDYKRHVEKSTEKHEKPGRSIVPSDTCAFKIKKDDRNVDLSARYAITVLDQVVKKEIDEVKESLEAAKQDLIEELSENSETVIQIKDSPSEFQFKLQPESIPNDLPFLYKSPYPEQTFEPEVEPVDTRYSPVDKTMSDDAVPRTEDVVESKADVEESGSSSTEEPVRVGKEETLVKIEKSDTETAITVQEEPKDEEEEYRSPVPASRSGSDVDNKDESSSLALPRPVLRRRQKPGRSSKRVVTSESEADLGSSSGESSNYQSCDYEIGSGSRPSSSDVEAFQSCGVPSATASEYETAAMSIEHSSASRPTSQEYHTAATTMSSRESMKSLASFSSGHLGSIDSTSELSETLVPSEADVEKEEVEENLKGELDEEHTDRSDSSGSDIPMDEPMDKLEGNIPCRMKRSSEMIFLQMMEYAELEAEKKDAKGVDFATSTATSTPGALQSVDIMTSRVSEDGVQSVCTQVISVQAPTEETASSLTKVASEISEMEITEKDSETQAESEFFNQRSIAEGVTSESPEMSVQTATPSSMIQQASMSTSSTSGASIETVIGKEKSDRHSPDSDSFEMIDKPDIIDDFVVVEEVGREAEEYDSEGKSICISAMPQTSSKHYDRDLENLISKEKEDPQASVVKVSKNNELFDFESEESPPQVSNDDQYSQSYSDEEQYEGGKKWIEMQFHADTRAYDIEYDRGPLEDIKEEEITDFEAGSSRFGSLGSHKESIGSVGSMRGSLGSTPDYDVLAGKKYFTRPTDHDNVSLSSLQEFEHLESTVAAENAKKFQCGSHDSVNNGSLPRRYTASKSGHGDDISLSSLKDFEGLEKACREAHLIEMRAREEEDLLEHESPENKYKLESLVRTRVDTSAAGSFNASASGSDDYEKRIKEIDEIIRIAQSNVEKFDRQDDTTEDISQIEIMDVEKTETQAAAQVAPKQETPETVPLQKDTNIMETSTDSLELEDNTDKKHHPLCRSSDSLEMKTTLDYPSLSSDSLNNVRDAKETQSDMVGQPSSVRRISSDSLDMPLLDQPEAEAHGRSNEDDRPDDIVSDNSLEQRSERTETDARSNKKRTTSSTDT
ncbi:uncharacterized protein LOC117601738 isoform X4 [Osmia lignaria lignaria]|uniref:uncharacterized protein LOC117601738 isoform X4 n=1 Tax=Osmia lignaria lignaria TaxID=1437193 RepID=UPI00402B8528